MLRAPLLVIIGIAGCVSAPEYQGPPPPPLRLGIAPTVTKQWTSTSVPERTTFTQELAAELARDPGFIVERVPIPPFQYPRDGSGRGAIIRTACAKARELGLDALVFGQLGYADTANTGCARERLDKHGGCAESSGKIESYTTFVGAGLYVVRADECDTYYREAGESSSETTRTVAEIYDALWKRMLKNVSRSVRRAVRNPPRHPLTIPVD